MTYEANGKTYTGFVEYDGYNALFGGQLVALVTVEDTVETWLLERSGLAKQQLQAYYADRGEPFGRILYTTLGG